MMRIFSAFSYFFLLYLFFDSETVQAQIEADNTLSINSNVIRNGINFTIKGGTARGNNLFHSFREFNIPNGGTAFFDNANSIGNIFTRVTGGSISNIDGIIKANGNANLFLMNPAGIIFGENARLNIGGSFLGTTAENIKFGDGSNFSTINPQSPPLLTINVPIGLQMGINPGKIEVNRNGANVTASTFDRQITRINPQRQLEVKTGNTLALIGGEIEINKGFVESIGGNIELASIESGTVDINTAKSGITWSFSYKNVSAYKDIKLQQALVNASGFTSGGIHLQGKNITLDDASQVLIQTSGFQPAGDIKVNASESLRLSETNRDFINTSFINEAFGEGDSGNIIVNSKRLQVENGAILETRTYGTGKGGNIDINSSESIQVTGFSETSSGFVSEINTTSFGSGDVGDVNISTSNLSIEDGGRITSITSGTGTGGNVNINAAIINLTGFSPSPITNQPSLLGSATQNAGNSGNVTVNTSQLNISDGANLNTSTLASGDGGKIIINASEFVKVDGSVQQFGVTRPSDINSSATILAEEVRQFLNIPPVPTGAAGEVIINTPHLSITNGAEVSVTNQGIGDAGRLYINTNSLQIKQQGSIEAETTGGNGGNIIIASQDLQLRNNSTITATARGNGNGGNIDINTDTLVALENSDITANAQNSFGGRITINAQGVFGIREREAITNQSDITASSQFGVNGRVEINNVNIDPNSGLVELPAELTDSSQQIAQGCSSGSNNSFVVTGKGGIPQNPQRYINSNQYWSDIRDLSVSHKVNNNSSEITSINQKPAIIEATDFIRNSKGEIELAAAQNQPLNTKQITSCSGKNT
ncbi:MAG: filamentous hemagglutinin N-terminal domain-containing protein [Cyanobacteria bacterium J06643_5]